MKQLLTVFLLVIFSLTAESQTSGLSIFDHLIGKTWYAEGKWGDGSDFIQEVYFQYDLGKQIVTAKSNGFIDQEQTEYGKRNFGVRKLDVATGKIKFWEFDAFGGLTEGEVIGNEGNIIYQYQYGESLVTDMWEYVNDSTYNFLVGDYKEGKWNQIYLKTSFKQVYKPSNKDMMLKTLISILHGKWKSKAWDGELYETWRVSQLDGHLVQEAQYIENGQITYQAQNKIEVLNDELILFTVIKGNNPKIFKATSISEEQVIFENSDYDNPNKVVYNFTGEKFTRTISGTESGRPVSYTFNFSKAE